MKLFPTSCEVSTALPKCDVQQRFCTNTSESLEFEVSLLKLLFLCGLSRMVPGLAVKAIHLELRGFCPHAALENHAQQYSSAAL